MSRHTVVFRDRHLRNKDVTIALLTVFHLKPGFQTPEAAIGWRRVFRRRPTDSRQKPTLTPPRMTTPEMRALVTGFSRWEEPSEAGGRKKAVWREEVQSAVLFFSFFLSDHCLMSICTYHLMELTKLGVVGWRFIWNHTHTKRKKKYKICIIANRCILRKQ